METPRRSRLPARHYSPSQSPTRARVPAWTEEEIAVLVEALIEEKESRQEDDPMAKHLQSYPILPHVDHQVISAWQKVASKFKDRKKTPRQCSVKWLKVKGEFEEVMFLREFAGSVWDEEEGTVGLFVRDWLFIMKTNVELMKWKTLSFPWFDAVLYLQDRSLKPGRSYINYLEGKIYRDCQSDSDEGPDSCVQALVCKKRGGIYSNFDTPRSKFGHVREEPFKTCWIGLLAEFPELSDRNHDEPETPAQEEKENGAKANYLNWIETRRRTKNQSKWQYHEPADSEPSAVQQRAMIRIRDEEILTEMGVLAMTQRFLACETDRMARDYLYWCGKEGDVKREKWIKKQLLVRAPWGTQLPRRYFTDGGTKRRFIWEPIPRARRVGAAP
ncbi:hypothetical protein HYFRA_00008978 [Hymenoscyphus fraxineus]|uniref:Myb-like domain-containing protein n=1 Tax=Hymenoscyphus fraxineus TaxID=746836 RepID=A0A9N9KSL3_9HELO|nr:hypothetical protein HYFRA_00008978 [Hymenoscyphus fraxineus]